ncbi:MAG: hypothetical protein JNL05_10350 [Flavobacteriales bacterium]|nr:hypothetical protein [Flavobacteriales bacterium]
MRTAALALLLGSAINTCAQSPFEYADQRSSAVSYYDCAKAGSTWVVCGSSANEGTMGSSSFAQGFNSDGSVAWMTSLTGIPYAMVASPGGGMFVAGPQFGCDVLGPTSMLMNLDAQGGVTWSKDLWISSAAQLDVSADGKIVVSSYDQALITDQVGDSLTTLDLFGLSAASAQVVKWDDDSTLLIVYFGGTMERRSLQGQQLASTSVAIPDPKDALNWSGHRMALEGSGVLHVLDIDLQELNTIPLGASFNQGRIVPGDTTLWIIGQEVAVELDTSLSILRTVVLDPDNIFDDWTFRGFAVDGDTIAMAGAAMTAQRTAGLIRTVIADGSTAIHDEDVSITVESIDTTWYELMSGMVYPRANATVRVTNEGSGILENAVVNHFSFYWICESVGRTVHLSGLNLAPGASITAVLDSLWLNYAPWGWVNTDQQFCISVLSPNNLYDRDQSDNLACDTAHIILGMADLPSAVPFSVVHDPLNDRLEVRFRSITTNSMSVHVVDMSGRMQTMVIIPQGTTTFSLSTAHLAAGIYALDVLNAQAGRWSVKWVRP